MIGSKQFKSILEKINLIDYFRYLYPSKRSVTWIRENISAGHGLNYEIVGTRLDGFYISSSIERSITRFDTVPCSCSDYNAIVLHLARIDDGESITFGKSYWKFNDELLDEDSFVSAFVFFWKLTSRTDNLTLDWWDEMKRKIKLFCIDYSKTKNKRLYGELKCLKKQYSSLDLNKDSDINKLNEIKEKLKLIERQLFSGSIIRSKANILDNNENPTLYFFFQKEADLGKQKTVHSITHDNTTYRNSKDIFNCFQSFYQNLYTEEPLDTSLNHLFLNNLPQLNDSDNLLLKQKIHKHEILTALKNMEKNKSPGSDGLSSSFYLKFFDIFGDILEKIINLAFDENCLSSSQKMSCITLICKDTSQSEQIKNIDLFLF